MRLSFPSGNLDMLLSTLLHLPRKAITFTKSVDCGTAELNWRAKEPSFHNAVCLSSIEALPVESGIKRRAHTEAGRFMARLFRFISVYLL